MRSRIAGILSDHPSVDLVGAGLAAWALWGYRPMSGLYLTPADHRSALYSVLAEAGLGLLGLVAAALSIVKGVGSGRRIERLRLDHGPKVTTNMVSGLVGIGAAAAVGIWAQIVDVHPRPSRIVVHVVYAALFLAALRLMRLIWVVRLILSIEDADTNDERRRKQRATLRLKSDDERRAG